jgi:hypothetical protein
MTFRTFGIALLGASTLLCTPAQAQFEDEIIVTGTRIASNDIPGTYLEVQGDFLLVEMSVYNDSRDIKTRGEEIVATLENLADAAKANRDIELSLLVDDSFVRPFSLQAAIDAIGSGSLPQTSRVDLLAKTPIPARVTNSYALVSRLQKFADDIDTVGRSSVSADEEPNVSVTDPYKYRTDLIEKVSGEIKAVTTALGNDYRAVITDLDEEMEFVRGGDLSLIFYIPYDYEIIPATITSRDQLIVSDDY